MIGSSGRLLAGLLAGGGLAVGACAGGEDDFSAGRPTTANAGAAQGDTPAATCALSPSTGCPCEAGAEPVECGEVVQKHDGYVSCSVGMRACVDGKWDICKGEGIATKAFTDRAVPSIGVQTLDPMAGKCVANPCDPYCQTYDDTPSGVLGAAGAAGAGGLVYATAGAGGTTGVTVPGIPSVGFACTGLAITPASATATVTSIPPYPAAIVSSFNPGSAFTVALQPPGCAVTPAALWTQNQPGLATISAGGVLSLFNPIPGSVNVTGFSSGYSATAPVNVVVNAWDTTLAPVGVTQATFTPATPPTTPDSITWLYPYDGTVYPLRLEAPIPQWESATAASSVRVILKYPADGSKFTWSGIQAENQMAPVAPCPSPANGCSVTAKPRATIPPRVWQALEETAKGADAYISVQRVVGGVLRMENPQTRIRFATASLRGTVYYNSYGSNLVTNYGDKWCRGLASSNPAYCGTNTRFGAATLAIKPGLATPALIAGSNTECNVCHSVAADGSRLTTADINLNVFQLAIAPNTRSGLPYDSWRFQWAAVAPDGSYLFTNSGDLFASLTTASKFHALPSGNLLATPSGPLANLQASSPSFSPEGTKIAFQEYSYDQKTLSIVDHNVATHATSNLQRLATPGTGGVGAAGNRIYYPAFLPAAAGGDIVYELETRYNGHDPGGTRSEADVRGPDARQNNGTHAEIWSVDPATKTSVRLNKLNGRNAAGVRTIPDHPTFTPDVGADVEFNYEATVNPTIAGGYAWVVFTSRRRYGNIATINPFWSDPRFQDLRYEPTPKKLWVAAMDLNAPPGVDASYPAFYLPGQELLAGNSRGYWVLDACIPSGSATVCDSNLDCCAGAGVACTPDAAPSTAKHCTTNAAPSCVLANGACTMTSQCCGNPTFQCLMGTCQPPPPILNYFPADFTRDYEGVCPPGFRVKWTNFGLEGLTPGPGGGGDYTRVNVKAQSADTQALLGAATPVAAGSLVGPPVDQSATFTNFDIGLALGFPASTKSWLRVTMSLIPTADKLQKPTITNWHQQYDCLPTE